MFLKDLQFQLNYNMKKVIETNFDVVNNNEIIDLSK